MSLLLLFNQPAAGGGIAASLSQTLGAVTSSAAAANAIAAQAAVTLGAVTSSAAATSAIAAQATATLGAVTVSSTATNAIAATASNTLGAATLEATFTKSVVDIAAELNVTLDDINLTATASGLAPDQPPTTASGGPGMRPFRSRPIRLRETTPDIYAQLNATLGGVTLLAEVVMSESPQYQRRRKAATMLLMH
jgi:hypothetical protein